MAELTPPQWLQGGSHPANTDRLLTQALVAADGIVGSGDLLVSERTAGANMSVDVAAGAVFIAGTEASTQGTYHAHNDAPVNRTVAAADATNPRIDLVIAQVRDAFYSGSADDWRIAVLTGTPAQTPAEPAVPDNAIVLARIDVSANAPSITDAVITDRRHRSSSPTGLRAIVTFTASGTFDKGDYPWLRTVRVRAVGAGGGGMGNGNGNGTGGPGGGSGAYAESLIAVDLLAASETVTVGAGGASSSGFTTAGQGGESSFGTLVRAGGGSGGATSGQGGFRGYSAAGDIRANGADGHSTSDQVGPTNLPGGNGGSSALGGGGYGGAWRGVDTAGGPGRGPGGGGGGGYRASSPTNGGNGADGIVIVELYA